MKNQFDENQLINPLKEDERIVEVAHHIAIFRNWFTDDNIEHFFNYWKWNIENGIHPRTRAEGEGAHMLEKDDKSMGVQKNYLSELPLTHEFNDFFKFLNDDIIREYTRHCPHIYGPVAHEAKIQQTLPNQGYHLWHCEWDKSANMRQLAYALFLNDVDEGGELEFLHQGIRIKPKKGDFVVWPAYFTHLHRGNPPLSDEKWIVTGWYEQMGTRDDLTP